MAIATATSIKPLGDRALVEPLERQEMTKSGIVLPDTAKEKPQEGTIVSVGSGRVLEDGTKVPMEVKKGNKVLYGKYAGTEIKIEGKDYLIVSERDILAICG
jgi:chaperonin GroES